MSKAKDFILKESQLVEKLNMTDHIDSNVTHVHHKHTNIRTSSSIAHLL